MGFMSKIEKESYKSVLSNFDHDILRKQNYWADNSYYLDLEVTIYDQWFNYSSPKVDTNSDQQ